MRRRAKALVAVGAALALGTSAGYADERHGTKTARQQAGEKATAAPERETPATGAVSQQAASKELSGKVLQASPSKLFLEHMGAVVEFNIASDAQFSGGDLRTAGDLAEGQEVRASFTVENKTTNVAKHISLEGERGATGTEPSPSKRAPAASPGERSVPGVPPREPGTTPPPK